MKTFRRIFIRIIFLVIVFLAVNVGCSMGENAFEEFTQNAFEDSTTRYCVMNKTGFATNTANEEKLTKFYKNMKFYIEPGNVNILLVSNSNYNGELLASWNNSLKEIREDTRKELYKMQYILMGKLDDNYGDGYKGVTEQTNSDERKGARQIALWLIWNNVAKYINKDYTNYKETDRNIASRYLRTSRSNRKNANGDTGGIEYWTEYGERLIDEAEIYADVLIKNEEKRVSAGISVLSKKEENDYIQCKIKYSGIITRIEAGDNIIEGIDTINGKYKALSDLEIGNETELEFKLNKNSLGSTDNIKIVTYSTDVATIIIHYLNENYFSNKMDKFGEFFQDNIEITTTKKIENASVKLEFGSSENKKGSLILHKTDEYGNKFNNNVKFALKNTENTYYAGTGGEKSVNFANIPFGNYELWEIYNNNKGYEYINNKLIDDNVSINSTVPTYYYSDPIINEAQKVGGFYILKKDKGTGDDLSNVWIGITKDKDQLDYSNCHAKTIEERMVENGKATFDGLPTDETYYIWEHNNNDGYKHEFVLLGEVTIKNANNNNAISFYDNIDFDFENPNIVYNQMYGTITVQKKDQNTKEGINGIWFDLKDTEGNVIRTGKTSEINNEKGIVIFENIPINKGEKNYTIRETNTTDEALGYTMNIGYETQYVSLSKNNIHIRVEIFNPNYGGLALENKKNNQGNNLSGVGFKIYSTDGNDSYTLKDTDKGNTTYNYSGYNTYNVNVNTKYAIKPGKYNLYEYRNSNAGYNIAYQGEKYVPEKGALIMEGIEIERWRN